MRKLKAKEAEGSLRKALSNEKDLSNLCQILMALGAIRSTSAVQEIIGMLSHKDEDVRGEAARALGDIGDPKAVDSLKKAWAEDTDKDVQVWAAFGLVIIAKDEKAFQFLLKSLNDQDDGVHCAAAKALGRIGDERAVEPLIRALEWADWFRVWAHDALQDITKTKTGGSFKDLDKIHQVWEEWLREKKYGDQRGRYRVVRE